MMLQAGMVCTFCGCRIPDCNCIIAPCDQNPDPQAYGQHNFQFPEEEQPKPLNECAYCGEPCEGEYCSEEHAEHRSMG